MIFSVRETRPDPECLRVVVNLVQRLLGDWQASAESYRQACVCTASLTSGAED